jgi:multidrug resistance efflux pump
LAPAAGVVLSDDIERLVGSSVDAGASIFELGGVGGWRARISVSEHDLHRIRVGDPVKIELPALSELETYRVDGVVVAVGWQPATSDHSDASGSPTAVAGGYRVLLSLDSTDVALLTPSLLRRGYVAHGKIVTRSGRLFKVLVDYFRDQLRSATR